MKIYSWNILFRNREFDRAFDLIAQLDFDVLCLQEVPEEFLARLKELPLHIAYGTDVVRLFDPPRHNFLVILSRHEIVRSGSFPVPTAHAPLRTRLFVTLMRPLGWSPMRERGGLWADVNIAGNILRVFDLHLTLAHPAVRADEFESALRASDPDLPTIVCGDFNILESARITILNWILGGTTLDVLRVTRERAAMEKRFATHHLKNPLRGSVTHALAHSQLDHILVPDTASVVQKAVLPDTFGSDHHPVCVEISDLSA